MSRIAPAVPTGHVDHSRVASHDVYTAGFYESEGWDRTVRSLLGKASRAGAEPGEVLATIAAIAPGDDQAWYEGWLALGNRAVALADESRRRGHLASAAHAYLRAANYLAVATSAADALPDDVSPLPLFQAAQRAWEDFVATTHWPVERVEIAYEGSALPGWLFHPSHATGKSPTLVVNNGSDGSTSSVWCDIAEGGLERGYRVLLFEGPGQQSMLFECGVPFRPDWEHVLTPVVDHLLARHDVDEGRLAVYGISQAGYWVPRALAFEHRFAAAAVDGGVVDISRSWTANVPPALLAVYRRGDRHAFDVYMDQAMQSPTAKKARSTWRFRSRPYGATGYSAILDILAAYTLDADLASRITTPLYITDPDCEQFFPGQPAELADLVPTATSERFTQEEGACHHCQPLARGLTEQRIYDWLDEQLRPSHESVEDGRS